MIKYLKKLGPIKLLFGLLGFVMLQLFLGVFFNLATSRFVAVEVLGRWCSAIFVFNFYANLTDLGLESIIFEKSDSQDIFFLEVFLLRTFLAGLPLFFFGLLKLCCFKIDTTIVLYGLYFLLDRTSNFCKLKLDKNFMHLRSSGLEMLALLCSYFVAVASLFLFGNVFFVPLQKIAEKSFLLGFGLAPFLFKVNCFANFEGFKKINRLFKTQLLQFGASSFINSCSGLLIYDAMPFFISLFLNTGQAGIFAKAYGLATFPLFITLVFNRIMTPYFARTKNNLAKLKKLFFISQFVKLTILIPVFLALLVSASWWFVPLLGKQWASGLLIFRILLFYSFFRCFYEDLPPLFYIGFARPMYFAKNQAFYSILLVFFEGLSLYSKSLTLISISFVLCMFFATLRIWFIIFRLFKNGSVLETSNILNL